MPHLPHEEGHDALRCSGGMLEEVESPECSFRCTQCLVHIQETDAVYMFDGKSFCSNACRKRMVYSTRLALAAASEPQVSALSSTTIAAMRFLACWTAFCAHDHRSGCTAPGSPAQRKNSKPIMFRCAKSKRSMVDMCVA
mmetsp:Transcript_42547/g.112271  ORF Transcript_42547/g.112271 Transcript_42547/m.112271 type:complete len:140 (-) Transcript_42547:461-880(-)